MVLNRYSQRDPCIISHSIAKLPHTVHESHPIQPFNTHLLGTYFLLQSLSLYNVFSLQLPDGPFINRD